MSEMDASFVSMEDEIMVLQSIYEDKVDIKKDRNNATVIAIMLHPATADDSSTQFVKLLLELTLPEKYPAIPLQINFKISRGLSDDQLKNLKSCLNKYIAESDGSSVLFDLIEMAKDALTVNNIPSCPCPICLTAFHELDDFMKTECYHYLHSYCMRDYVIHYRNEINQSEKSSHKHRPKKKSPENVIPCPVCRKQVSFDFEAISNSKKPVEDEPVVYDLSEIKLQVKLMEKIYNRQKENGGIIDVDAEKNKYLLSSIEEAYARSSHSDQTVASNPVSDRPASTSSVKESSSVEITDEGSKVDQRKPRQKFQKDPPFASDSTKEHSSASVEPRKSRYKGQTNNRFPFRRKTQQPSKPANFYSPHKQNYRHHYHNKTEYGRDKTSHHRETTNRTHKERFNENKVSTSRSTSHNDCKTSFKSRDRPLSDQGPDNGNRG